MSDFARYGYASRLLYELFANDRNTLLVPYGCSNDDGIVVLVDWSNIFIGFNKNEQFDMKILDLILTRGREWAKKVICGSDYDRNEIMLMQDASELDYKIVMKERKEVVENGVSKMKEEGVDEYICKQINRQLKNRKDKKGIIVLATGDGQPAVNKKLGFINSATKALEHGWIVEVYSFGSSLSSNWKALRDKYRKTLCVIYLDEFSEALKKGN